MRPLMISLSRVPRLHRSTIRTEPLQSSLSFLLSSDERYGSTSCRGCLHGWFTLKTYPGSFGANPKSLFSPCAESRETWFWSPIHYGLVRRLPTSTSTETSSFWPILLLISNGKPWVMTLEQLGQKCGTLLFQSGG